MERIESVIDDLKSLKEGIQGVNGPSGERVLIICSISSFLGDSPCQATILMLRETTSRANCGKCLRQYNMP
jgi:hypothetical protein